MSGTSIPYTGTIETTSAAEPAAAPKPKARKKSTPPPNSSAHPAHPFSAPPAPPLPAPPIPAPAAPRAPSPRPKRPKPEPRIARSKASLQREVQRRRAAINAQAQSSAPQPQLDRQAKPVSVQQSALSVEPSAVSAQQTAVSSQQTAASVQQAHGSEQSSHGVPHGWTVTARREFRLTPTEITVCQGVLAGLFDTAIAKQLGYAGTKPDPDRPRSRATVRSHLEAIFLKVSQRKRAPAIGCILLKHIELQDAAIASLQVEVQKLTEARDALSAELKKLAADRAKKR